MLQVTTLFADHSARVASIGHGRRRGSGFVVATDRVAVLRRSVGEDRSPRVRIAGNEHRAELVREDPIAGLALLAVPTGDATPATFASADGAPGQTVIALGDPGTGPRVTEGRISAAPLTIRSSAGRALTALEHTAPLPRGTGGAPLLDSEGALLGINIVRGDPGFIIALAGPVVRRSIEALLSGVAGPRLGVAVAPPVVGARLRRAVGLPERDGLLVREVEDGSVAAAAGVRPGDLLVRLGSTDLTEIHQLQDTLAAGRASESLAVVRGADELVLELSLTGLSA